jgi:cyclic pyranopterin phosphate synthase
VTDRCDLRCAYCMPERMTFLPRKEVLSLEELHDMALGFIARGITKIRLTGGEPLVRRDMMELVTALGRQDRGWARRTDHDHQRHAAG